MSRETILIKVTLDIEGDDAVAKRHEINCLLEAISELASWGTYGSYEVRKATRHRCPAPTPPNTDPESQEGGCGVRYDCTSCKRGDHDNCDPSGYLGCDCTHKPAPTPPNTDDEEGS